MRIDFHTHGRLTKRSDYEIGYHLKMIHAARESGLDGMVLSEHFNTTNYYLMYDEMKDAFDYENEYYLVNGIKVFMGLEVDVAEGGHVILVSDRDAILSLRQELDDYTEEGEFIGAAQLLDLADHYACLKIAAHPFRGPEHLGHTLDGELLARFDALDLNATDIFKRGHDIVLDELRTLSKKLGNVVVTGSDSHYPVQLGSNYTTLDGDPNTVAELREQVRASRVKIAVSEILDVKVFAAKTTKSYLKAQLFGG